MTTSVRVAGVVILLALSLFVILRRGRWRWRVTKSMVLNLLFWAGWITLLVFGLGALFLG